jgi:hypothetical protein|tara:strand:+ start:2044 stop:2349 length:306 start_codon:yes stop_codon:yes gene_type:complete
MLILSLGEGKISRFGGVTVTATTPRCVLCGNFGKVTMPLSGFVDCAENGKSVQDALPKLTAGERELLISGTHDACWDLIWDEESSDSEVYTGSSGAELMDF